MSNLKNEKTEKYFDPAIEGLKRVRDALHKRNIEITCVNNLEPHNEGKEALVSLSVQIFGISAKSFRKRL